MNTLESNQTVAPEEMTLASVAKTSLVFSLTGLVFIFVVGFWFWVDFTPVLVACAGVALVAALGAGVVTRRPTAVAVAFMVSMACLSLSLAFDTASFKKLGLTASSDVLPLNTLKRALHAPAQSVGVAACQGLIRRGYDTLENSSVDFSAVPSVVSECLAGSIEGTDTDDLVRRDVVKTWHEELLYRTDGTACELVEPYHRLGAMVHDDHPAHLFHIAHRSEVPATRQCAKEAFDADYDTPLKRLRALGDPRLLSSSLKSDLFGALIRSAYSVEQGRVELGDNHDPMREQWTLSLGCSILSETDEPSQAMRYMNTAMMAQDCGAVTNTDQSVSVWVGACDENVDPSSGFATSDELCRSIRRHAVDAAVEYARGQVIRSFELLQWQAMSRSVVKGHERISYMNERDRFVPADLLNDGANFALPTGAWQLQPGVAGARRFSAESVDHMMNEKMKRGLNRELVERYLEMAENDGQLTGLDEGRLEVNVKEQLEAEGIDSSEVFGESTQEEALRLLDDNRLDDESETSAREMLGEPPERAPEEKVSITRDR